MKRIHVLAFAVSAAVATSCGILQKDDDSVSSSPGFIAPDFSLTGAETSDISASQVTAEVTSSAAILKKFTFQIMDLSGVMTSAAQFSTGKNTNFGECVKKQIENWPLAVTTDTVGFTFDLDFISQCDSELEEKDMIGDLKNTLKVSVQIGCAGLSVGETMKTAGELLMNQNPEALCGAQRIASYSYTYTFDARKSFKTKQADGTIEVTSVTSVIGNESLSAVDGSPCSRILLADEKKSKEIPSCRQISQMRTFTGAPEEELNSPKEKVKAHPTVIQWLASVDGAVLEKDAHSYKSANTSFKLNGWQGKVTYTNGWAAPKWEATLPTTAAKVEGKL